MAEVALNGKKSKNWKNIEAARYAIIILTIYTVKFFILIASKIYLGSNTALT
jgi:hypothetical protein